MTVRLEPKENAASRRRGRVLVAMSGGVDSSVAAALLLEEGFDVAGMSIDMFGCHAPRERSCCTARDRQDAREVCERLSIPHFTIDMRAEFRREVMAPFAAEYLSGRTPSPCVLCNSAIKLPGLLREAGRIGADFIATGHYARVESREGRSRLLRALDRKKDQSYFLFLAGQDFLSRLILPLGRIRKSEVRRVAGRMGFALAAKPESREVCFAPEGDYAAFVESWEGARIAGPGDFVDSSGARLGRHRGVHRYTIGQRRGIGFGSGARRYVTAISAAENRVELGPEDALMKGGIELAGLTWVGPPCPAPREVTVKIRSTHAGAPARIEPLSGGRLRVVFAEPVRAPAPGQAAVLYDGDEVLGGGWIL